MMEIARFLFGIVLTNDKMNGIILMLCARVLEWETRTFEVRVVMPCGFESHLSHEKEHHPAGGVLFYAAMGLESPA